MSAIASSSQGVMEGGGAYNKHARFQAAGIDLTLPLWEKAVEDVDPGTDEPLAIADYGSSQGKNSLAPMRIAMEKLRKRAGPHRPIMVYHIDQASNDFNTLFKVLNAEEDRYALDDRNVFPCAIGRSFYEQVLPPASVHLAWSSYAAVWLSRIPTLIAGHIRATRGTVAEKAAFRAQAAEDWKKFLSLRARELRSGGSLVIVLPALSDEGTAEPGLEAAMDHANAILGEMVDGRYLSAAERARMVIGTCARTRAHLLAPFEGCGEFQGLTVERCELLDVPDPAWEDFRQDGDKERLAGRHARSFCTTFCPSLASALSASDLAAIVDFSKRLEDGLKRRFALQPLKVNSAVQVMVIKKQR